MFSTVTPLACVFVRISTLKKIKIHEYKNNRIPSFKNNICCIQNMKTQKKVYKKLLKSLFGFRADVKIKKANKNTTVKEYFLDVSIFFT